MWEEEYKQRYPELIKYAMSCCHDAQLAQDLVQEAFLRALQNAQSFEDLGSRQRRAWLFRTLKNLFYDRCRRVEVERRHEQLLAHWGEEDAAFQGVELEHILTALSPEDRLLFYRHYVEGYTAAELAIQTGQAPGTVRSRLSRARKLLLKSIKLQEE